MPRFDQDDMQSHKTLSKFNFSAVDVNSLGASEYTIVCIVQDTSSSVSPFKDDMEKTLKQILEACKKSPRSENLLLRLVEFNNNVIELHGFRELRTIDPAEYDNVLNCRGMTALYDATEDSIEATEAYGKQLKGHDFLANAIMFVITDGDENNSIIVKHPSLIKDSLARIRKNEVLESITTVLIGVGTDQAVLDLLDNFHKEAGLTQYVKMGDATPTRLAKLADFISKSVSSTSQALGTGKPSQPLTF